MYKREFERLSGAYCFTNTHGMSVVVRQNMCGVPDMRELDSGISQDMIQGLWWKLRGQKSKSSEMSRPSEST